MKILLPLFLSLLAMAACTSEYDKLLNEASRAGKPGEGTFYATIEDAGAADPQTKVYADDQMRVLWNAGDRITIFNNYSYGQEYRFEGKDGDNAGSFTPVSQGSFVTGNELPHIYAVYPHDSKTAVDNNGVLSVFFPSKQTYMPGSFGKGANVMVSVTDDNYLKFKNLGGYLSFKLYGEGASVKRVSVTGHNNEMLGGDATITMNVGGVPSVSITGSYSKTATLFCNSPVQLSATPDDYVEFWLVIPPTTFEKGFTLTVVDDEDVSFKKELNKSITIERNTIVRMEPVEVVMDYDNAAVPFRDSSFRQYCLENFDVDHNGVVTRIEAGAVKTMDCRGRNIQSMDGLEYFTNLGELECSSNKLTTLDISKNVNLWHLSCGYNQLTAIDVSQNPKLKKLRFGYNQLTSIDVSMRRELTVLDCVGNNISSLDLSNNYYLERLDCGNQSLTILDLTANPFLYYMDCLSSESLNFIWLRAGQTIERMYYDTSRAIIMYEVPIPDPNFKSYCLANFETNGDGRFSTKEAEIVERIDIRTEDVLSLEGIEFFTNLKYLSCHPNEAGFAGRQGEDGSGKGYGCEYMSFNESGDPTNGQLTALDVSNNLELVELDCRQNAISNLNLSNNTALEILNCGMNPLQTLDLSQNVNLKELSCQATNINCLDVSACGELTNLTCRTSKISDIHFGTNSKVRNLDCGNCLLTGLDVSNLPFLYGFSCESNQISSIDLSNNLDLAFFFCSGNPLGAIDVSHNTALLQFGCGNCQLTEIDVSKNLILSYLSCDGNFLTSLDVSHNMELGARSDFSSGLSCSNNKLTSLNIGENSSLRFISCFGNKLTGLDLSHDTGLVQLWCWDNQLTELDLSNCPILSEVLCEHNYLSVLDISNCNDTFYSVSCTYNPLTYLYIREGQTIKNLSKPDATVVTVKPSLTGDTD